MKMDETQNVNLELLAKKLFPILDKAGFRVEQMGADREFVDAYILIEELNGDSEHGYQAMVAPTSSATGYAWKPGFYSKLNTYTNQNGIFIERKDGKMIMSDPPIREVMLQYLSKKVRAKREELLK